MTTKEFAQSAANDSEAPASLSPELQVLWLSKAGRWHEAHDIAQDLPDPHGAWLHGHLHREEGDHWNASYWYQRANQPDPPKSLTIEEEWEQLAAHFLAQ
ncbi:MAG: hypothetical protein Q7Q71_08890 [Verrucomicrobiota bacterium JB023]|nr:hypothetical protein [Verrucomicrobiota bacterium JB023]